MICKAYFPEDREDIISLWSSCFDDERHYIEFFLDNLPLENVLFVYKIEKSIVGMFFLMPARLHFVFKDAVRDEQAFYVYAVGVLPTFRSRGIAGEMMEFAKAYALEKKAELCLVPANEGLISYYAKRGFALLIKEHKTLRAAENNTSGSIMAAAKGMTKLDAFGEPRVFDKYAEYLYNRRNETLQYECTLIWSMDNFKLALKEHIYTGGFVYSAAPDEYIIGAKGPAGVYSICEALLDGRRLSDDIEHDVMITTMSHGVDFVYAAKEMDGVYINFCFN